MSASGPDPSTGDLAVKACVLEVTAPKAGNVHPRCGFADTTWTDFLDAAVAVAPALDRAAGQPLGVTILDAVRASREKTGKNVNLGIILLLAPLATVRRDEEMREGVRRVLRSLGPEDCARTYEAIRIADPGGLGDAPEGDVRGEPPDDLIAAMRLAEDRDLVARQYARDFEDVLDVATPLLQAALQEGTPLQDATVLLHLQLLERHPDSLIARKCGLEEAREASRRAERVLGAGWPRSDEGLREFDGLDGWLRETGNRRNPGTTADLVAATLFLSLRTGIIDPAS
ncbi:MAG: triphosphoribosyl-dephospho-CoA synthase [Planctomycetota bacterium]|nr:triphosphoribosyl-dephospho-CoA synthase [Planctomycetota bacterium]